MALSTGTILAGRYEITEPIATGGMGEVWRARDRVLDRVVAAKVLRSEFTGDPSFVARFRNEARHTAALSHPNIASVYDYGETEAGGPGQTLAFLVMELVEGKPLVTILHEEGRLPVDWTLHVLEQAADGLSAAHAAGVVHRDIKPGNLIVRPDGVVKLTDFGIARTRDATPLTRTGMVVGTAQYLSPEQAQGMETTAASDVYSLGVVGYECLTGGRPFDGTSQVAIALAHINRPAPPLPGDIPPAVRMLVERALAKDPHDRFADGAAFATAIRSVASGKGLGPAGVTSGTGTMAAGQTEVIPEVDADGTRVLGGPATGVAAGAAALGAASAAGPRTSGPRTGGRHAAGARTMPPLQGPPVDGDDRAGWDDRPAQRRGGDRRLLWALLSLLLVAGVVTGAYFLLAGNDDDPGTTAGTTSSSASASDTATATQQLVNIPAAGQYIGEDAEEVRAELEEAGLEVTLADANADQLAAAGVDLDAGDVAAVDPAGIPVPRGSGVTLYVAQEDYRPAEPEEDTDDDGGSGQDDGDTGDSGSGNGGGPGNGGGTQTQTQTQTSTQPAPTTTTPPPAPTTTPAPAPTTTNQSGQPAPAPPTTASPPTTQEPPVDEGTEPGAGNASPPVAPGAPTSNGTA
jgi:eukaryotic-like serine/threonine-protein kinase